MRTVHRIRHAAPSLAVIAVLAIAGSAAWVADAVTGPGTSGVGSPQQPSGETLPASAVRGVLKLPAPESRVRVVARMSGADGEEVILAAWRSKDGWACLGWAEDDDGHAALCSNGDTRIQEDQVTLAGGGFQLDAAGEPLEQRLIGLVPQQATSVVTQSDRGTLRTPAFAGLDVGRGLHVFAAVLPPDAGPVTVEARDDRDRTVASTSRGRPPQRG